MLERSPEGWRIRDVGSSNGTYVNGEKLSGARTLQPGDEIGLGRNLMVFRGGDYEDEVEVPAAAGYLDRTEAWRRDSGPAHPPPLPSAARSRAATPVSRSTGPAVHPGAQSSSPPRKGSGPGRAQGVARSVQLRYDVGVQQDIMSFRLDHYDESGNRLQPVPVELRGRRLRGQITEGEEVEVAGEWDHGTLLARQVTNLATRAEVSARSWFSLPGWAKLTIVLVVVLVVGAPLAVGGGLILKALDNGANPAVPDVVGQEAFFASAAVERRFIPVEREVASSTMPAGRVVRTDPPAGARPGKKAQVTLYVAAGSRRGRP